MVLFGAEQRAEGAAAKLALLLQERGLGGRGEDLVQRLARWDGDRTPRAEASRKLAAGWAVRAVSILGEEPPSDRSTGPGIGTLPPGVLLAKALPDNLARRRDASGESWLSAGGRGYSLDPASPLASAEWLAIGDAQGQAKGARITAALPLTTAEVEYWLGERIERRSVLRWTGERVEARLERRLGAITLASGPQPAPDEASVTALLVEKAVENLADILPKDLLARARFAGVDALSPDVLAAEAAHWLPPLLFGRRDLSIPQSRLVDALLGQLDWPARQLLDTQVPREFVSPAGTHHPIDYTGEDAPSVEVRVQALFGLERHPVIGDIPLLLKLTSPAGRTIQSTRDLPGFWRGSWADVRKDMKGRYPKHRWPEEPWAEKPSLKTRNAFSNSGS
ncbi:MAG: ATP-dependent helicase C-terminal domain-containing protein, partial [Qipengyuania sp.]